MKARILALVIVLLLALPINGTPAEPVKPDSDGAPQMSAQVKADVPLYLYNTTTEKYLTGDNSTHAGILRLSINSPVIDTTAAFPLENGLEHNINFTQGDTVEVSLLMKGSIMAPGVRLGAELAAEAGIRTCGSTELMVTMTTEPAEHRLSIPIDCSQLEVAHNLELRVSVINYIGPPLSIDLYTGGKDRSKILLPVQNFAWLVTDLGVNDDKLQVDFDVDVESPLRKALPFPMMADFNITGPSEAKSFILAECADCLIGYWDYGKDKAKKGTYTFKVTYDNPFGTDLVDEIEFEITKAPVEEDSSPFVPALLAIVVVIVLGVIGFSIFKSSKAYRRRRKKAARVKARAAAKKKKPKKKAAEEE